MTRSLPHGRLQQSPLAIAMERASAADLLESGFLVAFATFVLTSWISFLLAELGQLRPVVVAVVAVLTVVSSLWLVRKGSRPPDLPAALGLLAPLAAGILLFFPPDQWILGGLDPGGYVSAGASIARDGTIIQPTPEVAALSTTVQNTLFYSERNRVPGWYMAFASFRGIFPDGGIVVSSSRVVPHGFHLFPVVLSYGSIVGGLNAELLIPPLLSLLSLAAFYLLVRRLLGTPSALLAAIFLALDPAEVWFSRYPDAELLTQLLVFGGLFVYVLAEDTKNSWLGVLGGFSVGLVHLTKIEMIPLVGIVGAYSVYRVIVNRFDQPTFFFVGGYLCIVIHATLHAILIAWWYSITTLTAVTSSRTLMIVELATSILLVSSIVLLIFPNLRKVTAHLLESQKFHHALSSLLPLAICGAALYAYFIRPSQSIVASVDQLSPATLYGINNLESFVRLGWFVTPLGLFLGTLGYMLLARRELSLRTALLFLFVASDTVLFLNDLKITPVYYWAARRWIPLVIPGFALAAGYVLSALYARLRDVRFGVAIPAILTAGVLAGLLSASKPLFGYVEYRGAVDQVGTVASVLPPNSVTLLVDGDAGIRLSVPLQYIFGRTSFIVRQDASAEDALRAASNTWLQEGTPVYWITTTDLPGPSEIGFDGTIVARQRISLPEKIATRDVPPGADGIFQQDLIIWRLEPSPAHSQTP